MKKVSWIFIGIVAGLAQWAYAEEVDFGKVNPVLEVLAKAVAESDDMVDFAIPKFDEKFSSFKSEKLKYDANGGLKNTPWLDGGTAAVQVSTTYVADRDLSHLGISVGMESSVKTDVMALVRYAARIALKKKSNASPEFESRIVGHLRRLSVATTLDEVFTLLLSGQRLAEDIIRSVIAKESDYLEGLKHGSGGSNGVSGDLDAEIARTLERIENWKKVLAAYSSTQFESQKTEDKVSQILVINTNAKGITTQAYFKAYAERAGLSLTQQSLQSSLAVFAPLSEDEMNDLKANLQARLVGAQNHGTQDKKVIQDEFRKALIAFKRVVRGENSY